MAGTVALNVALAAARPVLGAPPQAVHAFRPTRVVADLRFAPSVAFAKAMAERHVRISAIDGDPTALWFDDLKNHFADSTLPITGLTSARVALVLVELARGPGVRVLWRADHLPLPDRSLRHEIEGAPALVAAASAGLAETDWASALASALADAKSDHGGPTPNLRAAVNTAQPAARLDERLSSWLLVPARPTSSGRRRSGGQPREDEP